MIAWLITKMASIPAGMPPTPDASGIRRRDCAWGNRRQVLVVAIGFWIGPLRGTSVGLVAPVEPR